MHLGFLLFHLQAVCHVCWLACFVVVDRAAMNLGYSHALSFVDTLPKKSFPGRMSVRNPKKEMVLRV